MASTLETCTSGARPGSPSAGDARYETDTNRIIVHDGTDWRVYSSDGVAYSTGGTSELQYPTGLWSSASATYYISTSPVLHFDATIVDGASSLNNPSDGAAVATWGDRSGSATNYDASQATASQQPVFTASGPGSKPALTFDDASSELLTLANTWDTTGSLTAFFLSQVTNQYRNTPTGYSAQANSIYHEDFVNGYHFGVNAATGLSNFTGFNMITARRDGTSAALYEQGGTATISPTTRTNHMYIDRIGHAGSGSYYHRGTLSEIIVFDSALSTADLNVVRLYIANKYGLTTAAFT